MALVFVTATGIKEPHPRPTLSLGDTVGAVALSEPYCGSDAAAIETARALAYYAAYLYDVKSPDFLMMSHVAMLQSARIAVDVTRRAVQIEGGFGYSKESKGRDVLQRCQDSRNRRGHQ